jgi:hypothetical protein
VIMHGGAYAVGIESDSVTRQSGCDSTFGMHSAQCSGRGDTGLKSDRWKDNISEAEEAPGYPWSDAMQKSTLLTITATIVLTLATIEVWGQRAPAGPASAPEQRFQISAGDAATVYAIDTRSGTLWRYTPDQKFQKLAQIPDAE